jgi:hypothetical protein
MSDDYTDIKQHVKAYQYRQRASLILAYELEGANVHIEGPKLHFLHFFIKPSAWQRREYFSCTLYIVSLQL